MGVPPAEQCNESEGVCTSTDPASPSSLFVIEEHLKNVYVAQRQPPCEEVGDRRPTSWFFCLENQSQLRNMESPEGLPGQFNLLASAKKPIHIGDYQKCDKPSIEDKNNTEVDVGGTPAIQVRLESNDVSATDQTVSGSVQLNDIEAKCKLQKTLETVLKAAAAQECFERKLSETWKQECTTYDDLNRNIPSLSPYDDQSQNFADSGFVKMIFQSYRKKLNVALDIRSMTDSESCISAGSLDSEIQQDLDENCSPPPPEDVVVSVKDHKGQPVQEQQQKVARFPSKKSRKAKRKQQQGLNEPKQQPKKLHSSSKNKKRRQKKCHGSSRLRSRQASICTRGSHYPTQATKPKERETSFHCKEQRHVSDSGFKDEPSDAESSTPWQRHSCSPTKQGNSSSSGDGNNDKGGGRVSRRGNGDVGGGTGEKDDDDREEPPPGKDGESHIDITAAEWQKKLARARERQNAGYLNLRAPLHQGNIPPEVLRDETGDQAPSNFNLKPPPDSNELSFSADTSGLSRNTETSDAVMQSDPMLLHERVRNDSGFLSGPSPQVPAQLLKLLHHDVPRKKPASIAHPEPSCFHPTVAESNGVIPREPEGAVGDQGAVTADTTFNSELQKLARPPLLPRFPDVENTATLYSSLEYFNWENQAQDNVPGSPYTHFVSTVEQEQHVGRHLRRPREDQHHVHPAVDHEGLLDFQQYPSEESTLCVDRAEMVGCITPFLPPGVVCSPPSAQHARELANDVEPANAPTALLHANFESRIVGILRSPDLWTFTPQSDMYVPSVEPQTLVN